MKLLETYRDPKSSFAYLKKMVLSDFPYSLKYGIFTKEVYCVFEEVFLDILQQHARYIIPGDYYAVNGAGILNLAYFDHYLILCYRYANVLFSKGYDRKLCEAIYYSMRVRTGADIYYSTKIAEYLVPTHPIATVFSSHAVIGEGLTFFNGVTIGQNPGDNGEYYSPVLGNGIILYSNSSIVGKCHIGNNVIIAMGAKVVNQDVPSNTVVFGSTPSLVFKENKLNNFSWIKSES